MKIALDVSSIVYGTGVSDYTLELARHLPADQLVPIGFSLRRRADLVRLFPETRTYPLPPTVVHLLWNLLHIFPVEHLTGQVDVFHSSDWTQPPARAHKVTTIHDLSPFIFPDQTDPRIVAVHSARMKWVVRECDRIICVSRATEADLHRLWPETRSRTVVIPEALPGRFRLSPAAPDIGCPYLVAIGARPPRKNISFLVDTYLKYRSEYGLPPKLIIVGENSGSHDHPDVIFSGYVSDQRLVDLLAGAAAFVYPSLYEGFGLPVLGAFHHGVPVVASNTSSLPEVAGSAAVLVDPRNALDLAGGIVRAIRHRSRLAAAGRRQVAKFNWRATASATMKVYASL